MLSTLVKWNTSVICSGAVKHSPAHQSYFTLPLTTQHANMLQPYQSTSHQATWVLLPTELIWETKTCFTLTRSSVQMLFRAQEDEESHSVFATGWGYLVWPPAHVCSWLWHQPDSYSTCVANQTYILGLANPLPICL